jgi:hypothetical protein
VARGRVDETARARIEEAEKGGDEAGDPSSHKKPVSLAKHQRGIAELMGEGVNGVFHQVGYPSSLDPVSRHVPDDQTDATISHLEHIVEVPADLRFLRGRAI